MERIIKECEELSETKVDVADIRYKIDNNNLVRAWEPIREKMAIGKGILIPIEKISTKDNP